MEPLIALQQGIGGSGSGGGDQGGPQGGAGQGARRDLGQWGQGNQEHGRR